MGGGRKQKYKEFEFLLPFSVDLVGSSILILVRRVVVLTDPLRCETHKPD